MRDKDYLELLSKKYPTIDDASVEIINLKAISKLPKGTEYFLSDIHGESEGFEYLLGTSSGVIKEKIEILFKNTIPEHDRVELQILIVDTKNTINNKPSVLGLYLPSHLQLDEDEYIVDVIPTDYSEEILIAYANGKVARVPLSSYKTKTNRAKLSNATHTEKVVGIHIYEDTKYILATIDNKALIFNAKDIPLKSSRNTQGITVMKHSNMQDVNRFKKVSDCTLDTQNRYIGGKAGKPIIGIDNI